MPAGGTRAVRAYVGVGANLGDAQARVDAAIASLARLPGTRLAGRSRRYRSAPLDAAGPDFVNAVVALDTTLDARSLLDALHALERAAGRERPYRNAPRTLDLDLLVFDDLRDDDPALTVPHPRMHLRAFVLAPLAELAPELDLPGHGRVRDLLAALPDQSLHPIDP